MGVGLSVLIGLKSVALFILFSIFRSFRFGIMALPFLYASLIEMLVAIASHPYLNVPLLLGKRPDGSFPIWSKIMFSPFLYFVRIFSSIRRAVSREEPYTEVCEGVYVGGWPCTAAGMPPGSPAVIDCTAELPRKTEFTGQAYLCIPTWDTRSPQPMEIESAVKWACQKRSINMPVFIHCAYGHGRSVAVTCALLVALGVASDWKNAEKLIQEKRPYIRMNALHRAALEDWSKHRFSSPAPPRTRESKVSGRKSFQI